MQKEYFFREGCFITELHNTPEDPDLSIARVRVKPGETTKWHSLHNTKEQYLILEGEGIAERGKDPQVQLRAGDTFVIPAGVQQRIHNRGSLDLVFLAICSPRFEIRNYQTPPPMKEV